MTKSPKKQATPTGSPSLPATVAKTADEDRVEGTTSPLPGASLVEGQNTGVDQTGDEGGKELVGGAEKQFSAESDVVYEARNDEVVHGAEVSAARDGYRRGGRPWYREPTFITQDDLTEEQFKLLLDDANIRVVPAHRSIPAQGDSQ